MKSKTLTADCHECPLCKSNDLGQFVCNWGVKHPKVMKEAKGKTIIRCKLKK